MKSFLKENWFKLAIVLALAWFLFGLTTGSFLVKVCTIESELSSILLKYKKCSWKRKTTRAQI